MKRLAALKTQLNIERFVIIQRLKCGSFKLNKDDDNAAHAWDNCTLLSRGIIYLIAWAIVCYRLAGPSTTSVLVMAIVPTLFFINSYTSGKQLAKLKSV